jgi:DNA modification methylase
MIHLSPWQTAPWPEQVDCIITDPPYSERTHAGHNNTVREGGPLPDRAALDYASLTPETATEWGEAWGRRITQWLCVMCDHVLFPHWEAGARAAGLYVFPPVYCGIHAMTVRAAADGPASWGVWMMVARTKAPAVDSYGRQNGDGKTVRGWGSLPGYYIAERDPGYPGGKPLALMRQIVADYSHPGMMVADPCAGSGTTLAAAHSLGRRWWGAEPVPAAHEWAARRLADLPLFNPLPTQSALL